MAPFPPRPSGTPRRRPPLLVGFLGWLVPGLGQLVMGRPLKALLIFVAILPTFVVGWVLTDLTAVDPQRYRLDFFGQVFLGLPTLAALGVAGERMLDAMPPFFEVGRLYVLVAGLLNLVAVCDAIGDAIGRDRDVLAARLDLDAVQARERAEEADEAATLDGGTRPEPGPALTGWEDPT